MAASRAETKTGGKAATTGRIAGDYALAVGRPSTLAPDGWRWTKLTDVARLETGHTPARKHPEYWNGDIPWIGIRDATGNHGQTIYTTNQFTNELGINNSSARVLPSNTVCLSRTASVGYVVVMGRPMATSQDFVNWVCDDNLLDYRFLKYVLLSEHRSFLRFASGTTHQTIYFPEVKAFHICLPAIDEQRAIAHILGTLDAKIELNRRMNETLESMARAIFKSWFVDFDPVRAKMDGRQPTGMDEATAALFPDSLVHVDGELIPKSWSVVSLGDIADLQSGGTPKKSNEALWGGHVPWISPKVMTTIHAYHSNEQVTPEAIGNGTRLVPKESVLVMVRGMGLHQGVRISQARRDVAFNQDVKALVPSAVDGTFLLFALLDCSPFLFSKVQASGHGTGVLPTDIIQSLEFSVPPLDALKGLVRPLANLNEKIECNSRESETLSALRDTLLPKLLSGEIRVDDAMKRVDDVMSPPAGEPAEAQA